MDTFGDRLRAAMLAAGLTTASRLAAVCDVSRRTAEKWLKLQKPHLLAEHLFALSRALKVRMHWLMTGEGSIPHNPEQLDEVLDILARLPEDRAAKWIAAGRRMAGRE